MGDVGCWFVCVWFVCVPLSGDVSVAGLCMRLQVGGVGSCFASSQDVSVAGYSVSSRGMFSLSSRCPNLQQLRPGPAG